MSEKTTIPKYYSISHELIGRIKSGELKPGMKVPSENQIIDDYKVSNTTARKVLQEIVNQGWAYKIKGKGTYVQSQKIVRSVDRILSFTKNMLEIGSIPRTRVILKEELKDGYSTTINGRHFKMEGPVYKIHRLRYADEVPMLLEVRYISKRLCPEIINEALDGSLYELYINEYQLNLTEINQQLNSVMLEPAVLNFFNIADSIPGFLVEGATFCGNEMILEMEKSIYRGDKYSFGVHAF